MAFKDEIDGMISRLEEEERGRDTWMVVTGKGPPVHDRVGGPGTEKWMRDRSSAAYVILSFGRDC